MAGRPQAFQWAAPNQAELTFCANKPKWEGDVPGHTLQNAPQGARPARVTTCGSGRGISCSSSCFHGHYRVEGTARAPTGLQGAGSQQETPGAQSSVTGASPASAAQLRRGATETGPHALADGQGGGRGPWENPFLPTRHPGTWARRRGRGQQRGQQPPPPWAALPVSLSPSFPPRAEGETRAGRGPLAAPPIVFPFTGHPSKMARNPHPDQGKEEPH